jgi:signal transduction histidine kinase
MKHRAPHQKSWPITFKRPLKAQTGRELQTVFALLFIFMLLGVMGLAVFVPVAVQNESMAVRQRLIEVYEAQLKRGSLVLVNWLEERKELLSRAEELHPNMRFEWLVEEGAAEGIWLNRNSPPASRPPQRWVDIQTKLREALKENQQQAAQQILHEASLDAPDTVSYLASSYFYYLEQVGLDHDPAVLKQLIAALNDYTNDIPPGKRLFLMEELAEQTSFSTLVAERLFAAWTEGLNSDRSKEHLESIGGQLYALRGAQCMGLYTQAYLKEAFRLKFNALLPVESVRVRVLTRDEPEEESALVRLSVGNIVPGWRVELLPMGHDPFGRQSRHRESIYVLLGCSIVTGMLLAGLFLARNLIKQNRLTKLKNDFVATVTHELKTPLASTRLLVDTLLEGRCPDPIKQREYLALIAQENRRLSRLIDNFLTFSRMERDKQTVQFADLDPKELVDRCEASVRERFDACGCLLTVDVAADLPAFRADLDSMVTVLLNLLDNGCKYSNEDKRIALSCYQDAEWIVFAVTDHGIGMHKSDLNRIFERFYQVDQHLSRRVEGAGLGLSIVQHMVQAHHGRIAVESLPGKGSRFEVRIPIRERG